MASMQDSERLLAEGQVEEQPRPIAWRTIAGGLGATALLAAGAALINGGGSTSTQVRPSSSHGFGFQDLVATKSKKGTESDDDDDDVEDEDSFCSTPGESCLDTKCCSTPGQACFGKDANWAECKYECIPGRDPTSLDKGEWSCEEVGGRTPGEAPTCSKQGEDCTNTGCCADAGMQCFEKVKGAWATCKASCTAGLDLRDADSNPWTCLTLGPKTPDVAPWVWSECAGPHASCVESGCCSTPGMQCFEKDQYFGECMGECNTEGWGCTPRGYRTPIPAPQDNGNNLGPVADWVAKECAKDGENCTSSTCCAQEGMQCFEKNHTFAACRASCEADMPNLYDDNSNPWSCKALGPKTPGQALEPWELRKNLSSWVPEKCGDSYSEGCVESRCCKNIGDRCFAKTKDWATCMPACEPGEHEGDEEGGEWSCKVLGPETHRAYPSLYCFHVIQPSGYEPGLVASSMGSGAGIWECDYSSLFSVDEFEIGEGKFKTKTITFEPAEVVTSKDGTAGNAQLFMNVWKSVRDTGVYELADWTIKVDPDAVLLPSRLRKRLDKFTGRKGYVVNCAKPYMPEGPMMFGALEAISKLAVDMYVWKMDECKNSLDWQEWGEDLYMGKCLEKLGCERLNDWEIYSDGVCRGVDCGDPDAAAFHPMKDIDSWNGCYEQTKNPHASSGNMDGNAPQWFKDYMDSYR